MWGLFLQYKIFLKPRKKINVMVLCIFKSNILFRKRYWHVNWFKMHSQDILVNKYNCVEYRSSLFVLLLCALRTRNMLDVSKCLVGRWRSPCSLIWSQDLSKSIVWYYDIDDSVVNITYNIVLSTQNNSIPSHGTA